ncbi:MAG TPA: hypothetical protein VFA65_15985 [Bryobacteraceae bacterium]|nr:hypothetical protein [Bryobacteraceae bacterium]
MTISEEVAALQSLHGLQGYLVIGSVDPLPLGPIDLKVHSNDCAYYQARWSVVGESSRHAFEEQANSVFGRDSGLWRMQYFYRVRALD